MEIVLTREFLVSIFSFYIIKKVLLNEVAFPKLAQTTHTFILLCGKNFDPTIHNNGPLGSSEGTYFEPGYQLVDYISTLPLTINY